jgi:hypothetical protein
VKNQLASYDGGEASRRYAMQSSDFGRASTLIARRAHELSYTGHVASKPEAAHHRHHDPGSQNYLDFFPSL